MFQNTSNDIDRLAATVSGNAKQFQIGVVYRSPSVPLQHFTAFLRRVFSHISLSNVPNIVIGDFNEDIIQKPECSIMRYV